jgi:myo-inositol-1(or 4)-monophosphatase
MNVMTAAVYKAARGLVRDFGEVEQLQVSMKGTANFVSSADLQAEKILKQELSKARPQFGFLAEESGETEGEDERYRWIIDPLDGTTNFLHGIPHFCLTIALEKEGEILAGVTYDPVRDELFWAEKGAGAYLNDRRLRVSGRRKLEEAVLATGFTYPDQRKIDSDVNALKNPLEKVADIRILGSAALDLAYVAAGRFEGFFESHLKPWDMAAGVLLVAEAGGYVSTPDHKKNYLETGSIVAANDHLHHHLLSLLNKKG